MQSWLQYLLRGLSLAPVVVAGVEKLSGEAPGATKKQLAMDSLALASGVGQAIAPNSAPEIQAFSGLIGSTIDNLVGTFNAAGMFQHR